ncbi:MAG: hypothetical protein IKH57_11870 [Clostridia bacterium]|nr:hypothetical protein [Clostridia bacterium]
MKKEKHPIYWVVMAFLILLLILGAALFIYAVALGKDRIPLPMGRSV